MKTFKTQRRLAAQVLGVGKNKVIFDSTRLNDIQEALTRADMEELIKDKAIMIKPSAKRKEKKKKKKSRGVGSIKKKVNKRKQEYIRKIRKLRRYIKHLKETKSIIKKDYYRLRNMAKSGQFRNLRHLREYVNEVIKKGGAELKSQKKERRKKK